MLRLRLGLIVSALCGSLACSASDAPPPPSGFSAGASGGNNGGGQATGPDGNPTPAGENGGTPTLDPVTGEIIPAGNGDNPATSSGGSGGGTTSQGGVVIEGDAPLIVDNGGPATPAGCGDGTLTEDEACDDGNLNDGDGCNSDCLTVNPGYSCAQPGQPCQPIARCGDGLVAPSEQCDDENTVSGDGCSERCRVEFGKKCEGQPSTCTDTTCGDGIAEGAEACDDGNANPFDGCSSLCLREPNCEGLSCTSECGDGLVINEECDDGNTTDGDGCSSSCTLENGFTCTQESTCEQINGECVLRVPAIFRDFPESHPDFGNLNCSALTEGMVENQLDAEGRPVAQGNTNAACVTSAATFAEWYRDGGEAVTVIGDIVLFENGEGGYVNRWGDNGEPYTTTAEGTEEGGSSMTQAACETACGTEAANSTQCNNACNMASNGIQMAEDALRRATDEGTADDEELEELEAAVETAEAAADQCVVDCADDTEALTAECAATCAPCSYNPQQWCRWGTRVEYDGNPAFFPVDDVTGATYDPGNAKMPDEYGHAGWPWEHEVFGGMPVDHNFYFTSEVQYWFRYEADTNATLTFLGDDDVWVFINGQLAVDLGGVHVPEAGSITINAQSAGRFGLQPGNVYKITVFHAERQMEGSSFQLTLSGFEATPSDCTAVCGDGILSFGEECDDGENDGGYGECEADCTLGAFCGDGIVNGPEDCDNGPGGGAGCPSCRMLRVR